VKKYLCSVCGYMYDEQTGDEKNGVNPGTKWEDLPENWLCPLCGAVKTEFNEEKEKSTDDKVVYSKEDLGDMRELNFGELSAICSNLSKGCQKQYLPEEAELFFELSEYFLSKVKKNNNIDNSFDNLLALVEQDLNENYKLAVGISTEYKDRGALRALAWGEKVTKVLKSLLVRFNKDKNSFGENTGIYVCEICGFIYLGEDLPDVCPVCKVPKFKINKVVRG